MGFFFVLRGIVFLLRKRERDRTAAGKEYSLSRLVLMNNPVSCALRRPGDPPPVSLSYPSSHPGANASLVSGLGTPGGRRAGRSDGGLAKPDWLAGWEDEWGEADDWAAEIGHTVKLAILAPVTTWKILGQAITGAGDEIDWRPLEEDEAARRHERAVYRRQCAAQVIFTLRERLNVLKKSAVSFLVPVVDSRSGTASTTGTKASPGAGGCSGQC